MVPYWSDRFRDASSYHFRFFYHFVVNTVGVRTRLLGRGWYTDEVSVVAPSGQRRSTSHQFHAADDEQKRQGSRSAAGVRSVHSRLSVNDEQY